MEVKKCETCVYGHETEYNKPCVGYRENCQLYERVEEMTREEIIKELSEMRTDAWTDTRQMEALAEGIKAIKAIEDITDAIEQSACDEENTYIALGLTRALTIINGVFEIGDKE